MTANTRLVVGRADADVPPDRAPRAPRNWNALLRLVSPVVILIAWEVAARFGYIPAHIIAWPSTIGRTLGAMVASGELFGQLAVSLQRALLGVVIGVSLGTVLGIVSGLSRGGELVVDAPLQMLRMMPSLALVPLFILWFGVDEIMKVTLIAWATTFPIYLALFSGIRNVDARLVEVAKTLGLSKLELIWHVVLPGALPSFFVGLRYSLGISLLVLVVVEQINAKAGIGYLISEARDFGKTDVIVICLLIYSVLGLAIDALMRGFEGLIAVWRPAFPKP